MRTGSFVVGTISFYSHIYNESNHESVNTHLCRIKLITKERKLKWLTAGEFFCLVTSISRY